MTKYTLNEFRMQMQVVKPHLESMGRLASEMLKGVPGFDTRTQPRDLSANDAELRRVEGIIDSMTPDEREHPDGIDTSRRQRIARGSGSDPSEVNELLKQFEAMSKVMQQIARMG